MKVYKSFVYLPVLIFLSLGNLSAAETVYTNGFEGSVGSEWSHASTDITPTGDRSFLGQFYEDMVQLSLTNLPAHNSVTITFDLFVLKSWDGNGIPNVSGTGPDVWNLSVVDGAVLLNTTFSSQRVSEIWGSTQTYPGSYPGGGTSPGGTGAVEINTLGYTNYGDSVYALSFTFDHVGNSLAFAFSADGLNGGIEDESWGLDNVNVSVIPEPATMGLLAMGCVGLMRRKCNR